MKREQMLKEAIKNFGGYSPKHCAVANALIDISIDKPITIKVDLLCEVTNLKRSTVYFALKEFKKNGLISKEPCRQGALMFQSEKINYYIEMQVNLNKLSKKNI